MQLLFLISALLVTPVSGGEAEIYWGKKTFTIEKLPSDLPRSAREALEVWSPVAKELEYRFDLDPAARVLLVTRAKNSQIEKQMALAAAVIESFDRELPAPPKRRSVTPPKLVPKLVAAGKAAPKKDAPAPVPEDPEDPDGGSHPWTLQPKPVEPPKATENVTATTWGAQNAQPDTQTIVVFVVKNEEHFAVLLKALAKAVPHLEPWTKAATALQGFVLGNPLMGAYLESHPSLEEWNPEHELVNRLGRLCLLRRFGELPNWFVQGYAWHLEIRLQGGVYCFPWRDEFVWAVEHDAWPRDVEKRYETQHMKAKDFLGWKRGKYQNAEAQASWGMVEYLLVKEAAKLPDLLDELFVYREEHALIQDDPSSWRRDTEYEIPIPEQERLLTAHLGPEYLERATLYLRKELDP